MGKVVDRHRGGFCYELNGLFGTLLRSLGFGITFLAAQVATEDGGWGPEFDHLLLLVRLEAPWLADVGFGSSFVEPLVLDHAREQVQASGVYRLTRAGETWTYAERAEDGSWTPHYRFTLRPRQLSDFADECVRKQDAPFWRDRRICTRATPDGRVTLSDLRLITTTHGVKEERIVEDEAAYTALLRQHFGIED